MCVVAAIAGGAAASRRKHIPPGMSWGRTRIYLHCMYWDCNCDGFYGPFVEEEEMES